MLHPRPPTHPGREPISDPEVAMRREADGRWTPLSIALPLSHLATVAPDGVAIAGCHDEHRRLVKLVEVWMANVRVNLLKQDRPENQENRDSRGVRDGMKEHGLRPVSQSARAILEQLVDGLDELGANKKIDNASGSYMAICVERVEETAYGPIYSVRPLLRPERRPHP